MNDELISMTEAARILGVSKMSLSIWSRTGLLKAVPFRRARKFYRSEIMHFRKIRGDGVKPRHIGDELVQIKYKVSRLEGLVRDVLEAVQLPDRLLTISNQDLNAIYEEATTLSRSFRWKGFDVERWKRVLRNLQEEHLVRLRLLRGDPHPYLPFLRLCEKVIRATEARLKKANGGEVDYGAYLNVFQVLRNKLREKAVIYLAQAPRDLDPEKRLDLLMSEVGYEAAVHRSRDVPAEDPHGVVETV